jgi:predicted GIY-YIG superfamily endonuclease
MREEKRYFVYIIASPSKTLYTGITNSIRRRVREHKLKLNPGFAAKYNISRLVYLRLSRMSAMRSSGRNRSRRGRG